MPVACGSRVSWELGASRCTEHRFNNFGPEAIRGVATYRQVPRIKIICGRVATFARARVSSSNHVTIQLRASRLAVL